MIDADEIMIPMLVTIACREAKRTKVMHAVMKGTAGWWVRHPSFPAGDFEWVATAAPDEDPEAVLARLEAKGAWTRPEIAPPPDPGPKVFYRPEQPATCRTALAGPAKQAGFAFDD